MKDYAFIFYSIPINIFYVVNSQQQWTGDGWQEIFKLRKLLPRFHLKHRDQ